MTTFTQSVLQIFTGALKAFQTFPAVIGSALAFSIVTMVKIQLDFPQQESLDFLFSCLHWSFAFGAIFSLPVITAAKSRCKDQSKAFFTANLIGVVAILITFLSLYLFCGMEAPGFRYPLISPLATTRVAVGILLSLIAFIILAGHPKEQSDFASSFFMIHKAFFIALIYGMVLMIGSSGVARAVQALLYHEMSSKVFMYIGTLSGFIAFTIFVGYFPDFRMGVVDDRRVAVQRKPRFIEILFVYILVPIILALTGVLLAWAIKSALSGMHVTFLQLSIIAATYSIGGLWLHIMISGYEAGLAKLYRRIFPFSTLIILLFEAWALLKQLAYSGLKLTEYSFSLIWFVAAVSVILLIVFSSKAYSKIAVLTCVAAVISVLPIIGYHALPVTAQVMRLETLLVREGILADNHLTPASTAPEPSVRIAITDAVIFLTNAQDAKLPSWLSRDLNKYDVFQKALGFEQTWPESDPNEVPSEYLGTYLSLSSESIDISGYRWVIHPQQKYSNAQEQLSIKGNRGTYYIDWIPNTGKGIPSLVARLNDYVIIDQDLTVFLEDLLQKYPPSQGRGDVPVTNELTLRLASSELEILLVFRRIEVSVNPYQDTVNYWFDLDALYIRENP